jgi:antitoxin (DNA-binding transcriptional repressor) of toxin-antitoxin stability system
MVVDEITVEELRTRTAEVLARVQAGESFRVMDADGWPVAELVTTVRKRIWFTHDEMMAIPRPDPGMWEDIKTIRRWLAGEDV